MGTIHEAPSVELVDTFYEDDEFVGPSGDNSLPTSETSSSVPSSSQYGQVQSPRASNNKLSSSSRSTGSACSNERLMKSLARSKQYQEASEQLNAPAVTYQPPHPSRIAQMITDTKARNYPSRRSAVRRNHDDTSTNTQMPPLQPPRVRANTILEPIPSRAFIRPNVQQPRSMTNQPSILRQPTLSCANGNGVSNISSIPAHSNIQNNSNTWVPPGAQPRFGSAPIFVPHNNGARTPAEFQTQLFNRLASMHSKTSPHPTRTTTAPAAHSQHPSNIGATIRPHGPNTVHQNIPQPMDVCAPTAAHSSSTNSYRNHIAPVMQPNLPNFTQQARPVRPAYEDFLRQVQSVLPNVDVNDLLQQISSNPTQPIQLTAPSGVNTLLMQQQLQRSLEASMLNALNQQPSASQSYVGQNNEMIIEQLAKVAAQPRPPLVIPPSEDDMAKQDLDADAHQDEEYHEVETYSDYVPSKLTIGRPHPDPVVETSSLSTVEPPDVNYDLQLPSKVIDKGLLSALQLESVIYACQQHNQFLADAKTRRGFLIGDGAGVGKGRTIAGIIYENFLCGRKKSIWLSVSTDLKLDAERDLKDIGAKIPVYTLSKFQYGRRIDVDAGVIFLTYSGLVSKSQSMRGTLGTRLGQLTAWAGANFDGVIVFDECHKAKNISVGKNKKNQSKAAAFALEIQNKLPRARVVYASATGASETKHLGYMIRLGIWGAGTPYETFAGFCGSIEKRGVGAMELVAVDLKMRGSYIARQLSFKTTSFEIRTAQLDDSFVKLYNECVDLWAKALKYFSEAASYVSSDRRKTRAIWTSFWGAHQKFFKYLCIGAKVPLVVQIAKEALLAGKCVVIGLQSTGEAKTIEALEDGDINEFVSTAKATFESLVENHFPAPYEPRRRRQRTVTPTETSSAESAQDSETTNQSPQSSSSFTEEPHGGPGKVRGKTQLDEAKANSSSMHSRTNQDTKKVADERFSRNQRVLKELAAEKRAQTKSTRALRAKRRAQVKGPQRKSRIRKIDDSSDTEISNSHSNSSSSGLLGSSSSSERNSNNDSDETYTESGETTDDGDHAENDDCSSTVIGSSGESDCQKTVPKQEKTTPARGKMEADHDSDSDVQITAVRPKKHYEVIMLDSDDDEDEEPPKDDAVSKHAHRLCAMRDELYQMVDDLGPKLPNNTLDDLIDRLGGPSKVAEMTGRKGRIVKDEDGMISYKNRNESDALDNLNIAEKERFMSEKKLVAIISEAASSGISLQADKRVANKRRRVHITIELPWSADRAIQQFGRTHRSNQLSGPEYVFIISQLAGERRFASIVAKRLESLGALTHGDRRASTESRDLSQFNIMSRFCKQALELSARYITHNLRFANIEPEYDGDFIKDAREAFEGAGLGRSFGMTFDVEPAAFQVNHFLNRLLGMKVHIQNSLFKLFMDCMDRLIARRKVTGQYDAGILELNSESGKTRCEEPEDFFLKTKGGIVKCTLRNVQVERGISWEEATKMLEMAEVDSRNGFYVSTNPITRAKIVYMLVRERNEVDMFRSYKPNTGRQNKADFYSELASKGERVSDTTAERIWRNLFEASHTKCIHLCYFNSCKRIEAKMKCDVGLRHRNYCILSGGILTAWPYLENKAPEVTAKLQIVRLKLDAKNRVIGPIVPQDHLAHVRRLLWEGEKGVEF